MLSSLSSTNSAQRHAMCDKLSHYSFQRMRSSASIPRNQRNHVKLAQLSYSCKNTLMLLPVTYQTFASLNNDQIYLLSPWNFMLHTVGKWSLILLWLSFSHLNTKKKKISTWKPAMINFYCSYRKVFIIHLLICLINMLILSYRMKDTRSFPLTHFN